MAKTLKERFLAGEEIVQSRISMACTAEQVHQTIADTGCDLIYIDCQHGPYTEWDIKRICDAAEEKSVPVILRIKHTRHAYRLGNYCDLGVFAIKVPEVEFDIESHDHSTLRTVGECRAFVRQELAGVHVTIR